MVRTDIKRPNAKDEANGAIYKYRSINNYSIDLLATSKFYFSSPNNFNDPFDCNWDFKELLSAAKKEDLQTLYQGQFTSIEDLVSHRVDHFNQSGILCLSRPNCSILMWSHYAENHSGICLGFDFEMLAKSFQQDCIKGPNEVLYDVAKLGERAEVDIRHNKEINGMNAIEFYVDHSLALLKHKDWKYEQEFRFFSKRPGSFQFSPLALKEVIFGIRTSERDKSRIKGIIESNSN